VRILWFLLTALGVIGILISLPLLGFAALGFLGILADVGPAENREMGIESLFWGLPPLICGVVLCVLGLVAFARHHRHANAEPPSVATRGVESNGNDLDREK
jgi:hypothetical protein